MPTVHGRDDNTVYSRARALAGYSDVDGSTLSWYNQGTFTAISCVGDYIPMPFPPNLCGRCIYEDLPVSPPGAKCHVMDDQLAYVPARLAKCDFEG